MLLPQPVLMLELSKAEDWLVATVQAGFRLWELSTERLVKLRLPSGMRNICKSFNLTNNIVLSRGNVLAVSGIRQEIIGGAHTNRSFGSFCTNY